MIFRSSYLGLSGFLTPKVTGVFCLKNFWASAFPTLPAPKIETFISSSRLAHILNEGKLQP